MEDRVVGRSEMEREKDDEFVKNRKLLKLVDKYKAELNERIAEVQDLKARLLESSDIRVTNSFYRNAILLCVFLLISSFCFCVCLEPHASAAARVGGTGGGSWSTRARQI